MASIGRAIHVFQLPIQILRACIMRHKLQSIYHHAYIMIILIVEYLEQATRECHQHSTDIGDEIVS